MGSQTVGDDWATEHTHHLKHFHLGKGKKLRTPCSNLHTLIGGARNWGKNSKSCLIYEGQRGMGRERRLSYKKTYIEEFMEKQVGEKGFCAGVWRGSLLCLPPPLLPDRLVPPRPSLPSFSPWPADPVGGVASASLASSSFRRRKTRH